jgi:hypothetical protein
MSHVQAAEAAIDWEYDWETVEVVDSEPDLDADPEPDGITPGFTLRPHRNGGWCVLVHGEHHRRFVDFEMARAYLSAAEVDWQEIASPCCEPRPSAFEGHPATEGGE